MIFCILGPSRSSKSPTTRVLSSLGLQRGSHGSLGKESESAVQEIDLLYNGGADYVAIAWTAFWWLDFYEELNEHLRRNFPCVFQSERLVLFDLRFWVVAERLRS